MRRTRGRGNWSWCIALYANALQIDLVTFSSFDRGGFVAAIV